MNRCNDASWTEGLFFFFFWSALWSWNKVERRFIFNVLFYFEGVYFSFDIVRLIPAWFGKMVPNTWLVFLLSPPLQMLLSFSDSLRRDEVRVSV